MQLAMFQKHLLAIRELVFDLMVCFTGQPKSCTILL